MRFNVEAWHSPHSQDVLSEVKEGFGQSVKSVPGLRIEPRTSVKKSNTLPLDQQVTEADWQSHPLRHVPYTSPPTSRGRYSYSQPGDEAEFYHCRR
uniref:Uncharacterized protein n=1 Tax=Timema shepardi TaxID=629360 RepID=A0A7R9B1I5_TIMSH|nr:unnamed protein product [Timema shepardi]